LIFSFRHYLGLGIIQYLLNQNNRLVSMKLITLFNRIRTLYISYFFTLLGLVFFASCEYEPGLDIGVLGGPENELYLEYGENPFLDAGLYPISTFSVDADGASYTNGRRFIKDGGVPYSGSIRIEEYLNYFPFDYDDPTDGEKVALNSEISTCPWDNEHYLMRLGMKGESLDQSAIPQSNFVFLIDVSGSMDSDDKLELVKTSFKTFVDQLEGDDRVAIVTYSGKVKELLSSTPASKKDKIKKEIDCLKAKGSTAGGAAMELAYGIAHDNFINGGNNRIIMATDGDFNVGVSDTEELVEMVEKYRELGVYLTICGFGTGNLDDDMMEKISNNGNGTYEYIDQESEVKKVFVEEKSEFFTVASDCKIKVTFDSNFVEAYRLIGYENRRLTEEEFEDDSTDASEIGAGQTITALYEIIPNAEFNTEVAVFDFKYKIPGESISRDLQLSIANEVEEIESASANQNLAAAVAGFAMLLKNSNYAGSLTKEMIIELGKRSLTFDPNGHRKEFLQLVSMALN
jgi:Ca-activated chloride channel family protein